jgi:hypothetical protein
MKGAHWLVPLAVVMCVTGGGGKTLAATWKADTGIECEGIVSPADGQP